MHVMAQHPHTSPLEVLPSSSSAFSRAGSPRLAITANAAADTGTSGDGSTATITANDFLQLLVTELENQDPTANTDPNEYVNQLVQVSSLEQLIQINQNTAGSSSSSGSSGSSNSSANLSLTGPAGSSSVSSLPTASVMPGSASAHRTVSGAAQAGRSSFTARSPAQDMTAAHTAQGNLSPNQVQPPGFSAAAHRIAGALAPGKASLLSPGTPRE